MSVATKQPIEDFGNHVTIGNDIRALRKARGLTLVEFAKAIDRSVGFISQIERGLSEPSVTDLRNIAHLFDIPLGFFFGTPEAGEPEARHVVRAHSRRRIGNEEHGLVEELLSPDLTGSFEIIRSEIAPYAALDEVQTRPTEEAGFIHSGSFELELDGVWYKLEKGDSFRFAGQPYRWRNPSSEPAIIIWVISPPVY